MLGSLRRPGDMRSTGCGETAMRQQIIQLPRAVAYEVREDLALFLALQIRAR
jgi:hypothetical protein